MLLWQARINSLHIYDEDNKKKMPPYKLFKIIFINKIKYLDFLFFQNYINNAPSIKNQ